MPPVGFEPTISAGERPQTYALDRAATVTDTQTSTKIKYQPISLCLDRNVTLFSDTMMRLYS